MSEKKKGNLGVLMGAAFLMATSAIGPGFLTQTANFTSTLFGSFGFVVLASLLLSIIVQLNVWRVICVSGLRGQDVANKLLPGLGFVIAFFVAIGGFAFNIGNVGGASLGLNALLGLNEKVGYLLCGAIAVVIYLFKSAKMIVDQLVKVLGAIMILVIFVVIFAVNPPVGTAIKETFAPSAPMSSMMMPILTILGGTVGGYITFSGAHRLIDAGITGEENLGQIKQSSVMGIGIAAIVRVLLFLAILGVVATGASLVAPEGSGLPANPAAYAFLQGAGQMGYRIFGAVMFCAGITSIIGAAYTSVSFLKTFHPVINDNENWFIIGFIVASTIVMFLVGSPAALLVIVGALNGLILPLTLGTCLFASMRKDIMGQNYKHPMWLLILGIVVVILSAILGFDTLKNQMGTLIAMFQS